LARRFSPALMVEFVHLEPSPQQNTSLP